MWGCDGLVHQGWEEEASSNLCLRAMLSPRSSFIGTKAPERIFATSLLGTGGSDGERIIGGCGWVGRSAVGKSVSERSICDDDSGAAVVGMVPTVRTLPSEGNGGSVPKEPEGGRGA